MQAWGVGGVVSQQKGAESGPRGGSPSAAWISMGNATETSPRDAPDRSPRQMPPGGGAAPSIPEPEGKSLLSTAARARAPSEKDLHWPKPPPVSSQPQPPLSLSLGMLCPGWAKEQSRCCHSGGHSTGEKGPGGQAEADPPSLTAPESPSPKAGPDVHSLRTGGKPGLS